MKNLETIELFIDETADNDGIEALSLVKFPATEENWVALNNHRIEFKSIDDEKRIIIGLALVPDKLIYRRNGDYEYNIKFSKETVKKAGQLYLKKLNNNNATLEHKTEVDGVSVVESWIVENPKMDKSAIYNLNAAEGSWAVIMSIENDKVWQEIKDGTYLGISVEGYFSDEQKLSSQNKELEMSLKINKKDMEKNVMIEKIKSLIEKSELKNQKVDLASIKLLDTFIADIKQNQKAAEAQGAILGKSLGQAEIEKRKFQDIIKSMKSGAFLGAKNAIDDFLSKAKELGIDASGTPQIKEIEKLIASTKEYDAFEKSIGTIPQV